MDKFLLSIILFLSAKSLVNAQHAQSIEPHGGGEFIFESHVCLQQHEREEIQLRLQKTVNRLVQEGKMKKDPEKSIVLFDWVLEASPSLNFYNTYSVSGYVDQNTGSGVLDYNCGTTTYNGHAGSDFFTWPFPWYLYDHDLVNVVAGAAGVIIGKDDGNADDHCSCTGLWNAVYIRHADNSVAWYGHLKSGSLTTKNVNDPVSAGEYLGVVASSGCSTGPHLHLELHDSGNNLIDPFQGSCNSLNPSSWWISQPGYTDSRINAVLTHHLPPVVGCPAINETPNFEDNFSPGQTIYFAAYYRDQMLGDPTNYRLRRPDNSIWNNWAHNSTGSWSASYWWWSFNLPLNGPYGTWTFEADYNGQTYAHNFTYAGVVATEILSFMAYSHDHKTVELEWIASEDLNHPGYEIEFSNNGLNWEILDFIPTNNISHLSGSYQYKHPTPANGFNYYRLAIIDNSGNKSYSEIRTVNLNLKNELLIWPNPISNSILNIHGLTDDQNSIYLFDITGQKVRKSEIIDGKVDISSMPKGLYYLFLEIKDVEFVNKIIIQ